MLTFAEFMAHRESTAAKRAKTASLLGLAAPIAEPNINAGATADPRLVDYYTKNVKKKNKKKPKPKKKKGKKMSKLRESFDKPTPPINRGVDKWLDSVDRLKKGLKHPTDDVPEDDEMPDDLGAGDEDMPDEDMPDEDMPDEDMPDEDMPDEEGDEGGDEGHPLDEPFDEPEPDDSSSPPDEPDLGKPPMKKPLLGGKFGASSKSVPSFREWVQYREKKQR